MVIEKCLCLKVSIGINTMYQFIIHYYDISSMHYTVKCNRQPYCILKVLMHYDIYSDMFKRFYFQTRHFGKKCIQQTTKYQNVHAHVHPHFIL